MRGEREFGRSRVAGSLWRYALRTAAIIVRSYRDYWPLYFFGMIAFALLVCATETRTAADIKAYADALSDTLKAAVRAA